MQCAKRLENKRLNEMRRKTRSLKRIVKALTDTSSFVATRTEWKKRAKERIPSRIVLMLFNRFRHWQNEVFLVFFSTFLFVAIGELSLLKEWTNSNTIFHRLNQSYFSCWLSSWRKAIETERVQRPHEIVEFTLLVHQMRPNSYFPFFTLVRYWCTCRLFVWIYW